MNIMDVFTRLDLCKCTHSGQTIFVVIILCQFVVTEYSDAAAEECTKSGWTHMQIVSPFGSLTVMQNLEKARGRQ